MGLVRYLQHWLGGAGPRLQVADFVPDPHPLRRWADTFPWAALVAAVEQNFATRFPKRSRRGRPPIPIRVLLALELLKHEVGASDEAICARLRTDFAVMYTCGLREYQALREQASFVLPETLCEFRSRIDEVLMDEIIAIQAAAAARIGRPPAVRRPPLPARPVPPLGSGRDTACSRHSAVGAASHSLLVGALRSAEPL